MRWRFEVGGKMPRFKFLKDRFNRVVGILKKVSHAYKRRASVSAVGPRLRRFALRPETLEPADRAAARTKKRDPRVGAGTAAQKFKLVARAYRF